MKDMQNSIVYKTYIREAAAKLKCHETEESYILIMRALTINTDSPEPHNLLGIYNEFSGNEDLARKHYRASYALDPTYGPASRNLERLCAFYGSRGKADFGI